MINVLIATKPDDTHAINVKLALEKKGHSALIWYTADFPQQQKHTFELVKTGVSWHASGTQFQINNDQFNAVWFRRPRRPLLPDTIHPDDKLNAMNENLSLFKTFWQVVAPDAFWINPFSAIPAANCKLKQLIIATEIGLKIPDTLISNDPEKIKTFIRAQHQNGTVYKTLYPVLWPNEIRLVYTKSITINDLPTDAMLQNTPSIFQNKIEKAFELRVTYFGETPIAVKLRSQEHPKGIMDWRYVPTGELVVEEFDLPDAINAKCKMLMKRLGIVFGCFDFIVTPDNDYYFLEVNEQGQFLWIEELCPKIKMLDYFTQFIISSTGYLNQGKSSISVSLAEFTEETAAQQKRAMELHKDPGIVF